MAADVKHVTLFLNVLRLFLYILQTNTKRAYQSNFKPQIWPLSQKVFWPLIKMMVCIILTWNALILYGIYINSINAHSLWDSDVVVFFIGRSISDDIKLFSDILVHPQTTEAKVQPSNVYESVFGFGKKKFLVKTTGILWMENICPHPRPLETNSRPNQILINFSW